jgi:hypothetical protein
MIRPSHGCHVLNRVRQTEIYGAEPLVPEPSVFVAVIVVECV